MSVQSFEHHVDSIDVAENEIAVGLSSLEGNIWDGVIKLVSKDSGAEIHSKKSAAGITMLRYTSDHNYILTARDDGNVAMYSALDLDELQLFSVHDDIVSSIAIDQQNEGHFYSAGWDGCIYCWDLTVASESPKSSILNAHYGNINDISCQLGGEFVLASTGDDGFVRIWDRRERPTECANIFSIDQRGSCLAWDPLCSERLWVGTDAGHVLSVDCRSGESVDLKPKFCHDGRVRRINVSSHRPDLILTASDDGTAGVFHREMNGTTIQLIQIHSIVEHQDFVTDVAWLDPLDPAGQILTASTDKTIRLSWLPPPGMAGGETKEGSEIHDDGTSY